MDLLPVFEMLAGKCVFCNTDATAGNATGQFYIQLGAEICGVYGIFLFRRKDPEVVFSGKVFFIIIEKL